MSVSERNKLNLFFSGQGGNALIVVLFLISSISILVPLIANVFEYKTTETSYNNTLLARDVLATNMKKTATAGSTFYNSLAANPALETCLFDDTAIGGPGMDCKKKGGDYDIKLTATALDPGSGSLVQKQVTGDQLNPIYYNLRGEICAKPGESFCIFKVHSTFRPDCGGPAVCDMAVNIVLSITIETVGQAATLAPLDIALTVPVASISRPGLHTPPPLPPPKLPPKLSGPPPPKPPPPPPKPVASKYCPSGSYAGRGGGCRTIYL